MPSEDDLDRRADLPSQRFRRDHNVQRGAFSRSRDGEAGAGAESGSRGPAALKAM